MAYGPAVYALPYASAMQDLPTDHSNHKLNRPAYVRILKEELSRITEDPENLSKQPCIDPNKANRYLLKL